MADRAPPVVIRRAEAGDAHDLTELMRASAAYSGDYASILANYAVTPGQITRDQMFVAIAGEVMVGFYSLTLEPEAELDLMFVADAAQGRGIGALLLAHMRRQAHNLGLASVRIVSHPPSEVFYRRMGAVRVGTMGPTPTAPWERPILTLAI